MATNKLKITGFSSFRKYLVRGILVSLTLNTVFMISSAVARVL